MPTATAAKPKGMVDVYRNEKGMVVIDAFVPPTMAAMVDGWILHMGATTTNETPGVINLCSRFEDGATLLEACVPPYMATEWLREIRKAGLRINEHVHADDKACRSGCGSLRLVSVDGQRV
jgi:hypothetical protein